MSSAPALVWRGPRSRRAIALTFDDGPHPETTPLLLESLARHGARATFFPSGTHAERYPSLLGDIVSAGHAIGSHGYEHRRGWFRTTGWHRRDLDRAETALGGYLSWPQLYRPPFTFLSPQRWCAARSRNYTIALWNVSGEDWKHTDSGTLESRLQSRVRAGAIVLLHECHYASGIAYLHTVEAVERFLSRISQRDLQAVTVTDLFTQER